MSIVCKILLRRDATPRELRELGDALHRWYARESREHGMALYTNGEDTEALRAGKLPVLLSSGGKARRRRTISLAVRAGKTYNRQATIESFRQDIRGELVADVLIDGKSWTRVD
jgi:hypothetical protein